MLQSLEKTPITDFYAEWDTVLKAMAWLGYNTEVRSSLSFERFEKGLRYNTELRSSLSFERFEKGVGEVAAVDGWMDCRDVLV